MDGGTIFVLALGVVFFLFIGYLAMVNRRQSAVPENQVQSGPQPEQTTEPKKPRSRRSA